MVAERVSEAFRAVGRFGRRRPSIVPVGRIPDSELIRLGGGDLIPTPMVPDLPTADEACQRGLCGESLALPPAGVRLLRDVELCAGEDVVRMSDGSIVANNASAAHLSELARQGPGGPVLDHEGTAALHMVPANGVFESLVEALPPAVLMQHPALHPQAPVTVFYTRAATMLEDYLLNRVANRQVSIQRVGAGTVIRPALAVFAAPVAREGAGALPRWYRRWVDEQAAGSGAEPAARKVVLTHGPDDLYLKEPALLEAAAAAGFVHVDTVTGAVDGDGALDADELVATLRGASAVLGSSDDALGHCVIAKRAHIVQVAIESEVTPRVAQLAASRSLPYTFTRAVGLPEVLEAL